MANQENGDEEFWQALLADQSHVLSNLFHYPIVIIKAKAYVGGKSVTNTGGSIVDFLVRNQVTSNAALVEIKTPVKPLLGPLYRGNVFNISSELSGAVQQVLHYRRSLLREFTTLSDGTFEVPSPQCYVIIGNASKELDSPEKRHSFEAFRNELHGVAVVTYDEMFGRVERLMELVTVPGEE